MFRPCRLAASILLAATLASLLPSAALAGTVKNANPYWFQDTYTDTSSVNLAASTATVNISGPGTVQLPYAPLSLSFDPTGSYALVCTEQGIVAYVYDSQAVVPVTTWNLSGVSGTTGVSWIADGAAFAASTTSEVAVYGLQAIAGGGYNAVMVAETSFSGARGIAPGPKALPFSSLVATGAGATIMEAQGSSYTAVSGGPAGLNYNLGVAATANGALAATWQAKAVQIWAWDGSGYLAAPAWDPPTPPVQDGPVAGVAFFPHGTGYWVLTQQGDLLAYSLGPWGIEPVSSLSIMVPIAPALPGAVATGWPGGPTSGAAVLYPSGWNYYDEPAGSFGQDAPRSLSGQSWPVYAPTAILESVVLPVNHNVNEVRLEDANCASGQTPPNCTAAATVPSGTSVGYQVSTDGCGTWTSVPLFTNTYVPSGDQLCYLLTLSTSNPDVTPVVDVTNLYEIVTTIVNPYDPPYASTVLIK